MKNVKKQFSMMGKHFMVFLLVFGLTGYTFGQDTQKKEYEVAVTLRNGQEFIGILKEETDARIVLIVRDIGEMTIDKSRIRSMKSITSRESEVDDKGYTVDYHNSTRYLISPSGYGLKRGQSYYENIYIFFNSFAFGISDRFTLAVGGEVASLLFAGETPVLYASPRFNFPFGDDKGAFSAGAIFFTIPESSLEAVGLAQAALTIGNRNNNINFGFGVGFTTDNDNSSVLMFNLSAVQRLSRKLSFVTDNFVFTDGGFDDDGDNIFVLSAALRIHFSNPGSALNIGFWRPLEHLDDLVALPMISATIPLR